MSDFGRRISTRFWMLWFAFLHAPTFKLAGRGAFLYRPFRVDGSAGIELGAHTAIQCGGWLYCRGVDGIPSFLTIGSGCVFGYNNHITAVRHVVIGDNVLTANNVYISDNLHEYEDPLTPIMHQPVRFKRDVVVGDGCWIGENACIIGARIGKNCVIGANAVVTHDIPDYSVAVGVPAVVIRHFDPQSRKWVKDGLSPEKLKTTQ